MYFRLVVWTVYILDHIESMYELLIIYNDGFHPTASSLFFALLFLDFILLL